MTTSIKTPEATPELAPVVQLSEHRAVRTIERKTGRSVNPDNAVDTMRVAMTESMDITPKQKKILAIGLAAVVLAMPLLDGGKKVVGSIFNQLPAPTAEFTEAKLSALPQETVTVRVGEGADAAIIAADQEELLDGTHPNERYAVEQFVGDQLTTGNVADVPIIPGIDKDS